VRGGPVRITVIVPTRHRPEQLAATLRAIAALAGDGRAECDAIVIDNGSDDAASVQRVVAESPAGERTRCIRLEGNVAAASRNIAAREAAGDWLLMLDDDSHPLDSGVIDAIRDAADDVAAIGAEIVLPDGTHEAGGLPEVIVGCGAAIRREAFLDTGGYDGSFHFYAEEYDLCARLILARRRITHDFRFRVRHEKSAAGRDFSLILQRLVRNNGWVMQRYAPEESRVREIHAVIARYAQIGLKEHAAGGYAAGAAELLQTLESQARRPLDEPGFERFTGLAHARRTLRNEPLLTRGTRVAIVEEGKNASCVRAAVQETGVRIVEEESEAEVAVIGTLSPGPMIDAWNRRAGHHLPTLLPWRPAGRAPQAAASRGGDGRLHLHRGRR
jgi:GT2 family glycosyltransferase